MILVVGGIGSGKREFARALGFAENELSSNAADACPVLCDAQDLARVADFDAASVAEELAALKHIVLCQDVGSGIVPMEREERDWRDRVGAFTRALAERATAVVRMTCGISQAIKGTLPRTSLEVVIMRHGATVANEKRQYAGKTDVALTGQGEQQARAAGVCEAVGRVFVSPLSRARRTAEICFPNAQQQVVDGFCEMDFGDFEGRSAQDMEDDAAYRAWVDSNCTDPCPNGGSRAQLEADTIAALNRVVRDALLRGDERVIVVGHGGTIMAAMDALCPTECNYFEWQVGNCEGYRATARFLDGDLVLEDEKQFTDLGFLDAHPEPGSSFFQNRACEYFPCHKGVPEEEFNCLFCYCPLYALGADCGGNFSYTEKGRKNCKGCALPHRGTDGVRMVAERYDQLAALAQRKG